MKWRIPGTVLEIQRENADGVEDMFSSMFLAGGIVLSQVSNITGLEPYTVQNWVKRGFLSPPQRQRYSLNQLCRILQINMLKSVLPLEQICGLLSYINGKLDEESDDIIDDAVLYFMFVKLAARARYIGGTESWDIAIENAASLCTVILFPLNVVVVFRLHNSVTHSEGHLAEFVLFFAKLSWI